MKTTFKALVLAASLSMIAGSAFAIDTDLVTLTDTAAPFATAVDAVAAVQELVVAGGLLGADIALLDNVAAILQFGTTDINYAFIDQSVGVNNVAVIAQDSTNNGNSAAIIQSGTGNRAFINQH